MIYGATNEPQRPPQLNDSVQFECGQIIGATRYEFRIKLPNTLDYSVLLQPIASNSRLSSFYEINEYGTYSAQCRGCGNASEASCQQWE